MQSIRLKIICAVTVIVFISCSILTIGAGFAIFNSTNATLQEMMVPAVDLAAKNVALQVETLQDKFGLLVKSNSLTMPETAIGKEVRLDMLKQEKEKNSYNVLAMLNMDGTTYLASDQQSYDFTQSEDFKTAVTTGEIVMGDPTPDAQAGTVSFTMLCPMKYGADYTYVLLAVCDYKDIGSILDNITVGQTGRTYMVNKDGYTIADKKIENVLKRDNVAENAKTDPDFADLAQIHKKMTEGATGIGEYDLMGSDRIAAYTPVAGTEWVIAATAPVDEFMTAMQRSITICLIISISLCVVGIVVSMFVATHITKPIVAMTKRIELLAEGDLSSPVPKITAKDETGRLAATTETVVHSLNEIVAGVSEHLDQMAKGNFALPEVERYAGDFAPISGSMNEIVNALNDAFSQIYVAAEQVTSGSEQVSSGAQALSQGATEQASSLEELSSAINEISEQVRYNAERASSANQLSAMTDQKLVEGSMEMQQMLTAMNAINEASGKIGNIIKTIDSIAFQTNILALNAAVEAARAGAAGKGFAVVADEVRNLAGKSAEAAKNTTALIENSVEAVERGRKIADRTAKTLTTIIDDAKNSTDLVSQISGASDQQAQSITQITQGVEQISSVVQTNSATAEQSAAASEELSGQAHVMKSLVEQFRLRQSRAQLSNEAAFQPEAGYEPPMYESAHTTEKY